MAHSILPIERKNGTIIFAIVFHGDSLDRIKNHDPGVAEGLWLATANRLPQRLLRDSDIMVCYEENAEEFAAKVTGKTPVEIMKYLQRGFESRPGEDKAVPVVVGRVPKSDE